jgi:hypothetical protein
MTAKPDPLIHPITRLSICGLLAAGADWVEFAALRDAAGISDSVLSKQSRQAVEGHLAWLAQLEEAFSASTRDVRQARPLPGDRDQPRRVLPPLLGST